MSVLPGILVKVKCWQPMVVEFLFSFVFTSL